MYIYIYVYKKITKIGWGLKPKLALPGVPGAPSSPGGPLWGPIDQSPLSPSMPAVRVVMGYRGAPLGGDSFGIKGSLCIKPRLST